MPIAAILHHTITSHRTHIQCNMRRITDSEYTHTMTHTLNQTTTQRMRETAKNKQTKQSVFLHVMYVLAYFAFYVDFYIIHSQFFSIFHLTSLLINASGLFL